MANGLKKIIDFAKQNKETCIVLDQDGDPQYVVIDFERYQQLSREKSAPIIEEKPPVIEPIPSQKSVGNSLNQEKKYDIPTEPEDAYYFEPID